MNSVGPSTNPCGTPHVAILSPFDASTANLNLCRHYPEELYVRIQMSEPFRLYIKQTSHASFLEQSQCNAWLSPCMNRATHCTEKLQWANGFVDDVSIVAGMKLEENKYSRIKKGWWSNKWSGGMLGWTDPVLHMHFLSPWPIHYPNLNQEQGSFIHRRQW